MNPKLYGYISQFEDFFPNIDGYIKRTNNGKQNSEEDIAIEEIVERGEFKKPKVVRVSTQKEAV